MRLVSKFREWSRKLHSNSASQPRATRNSPEGEEPPPFHPIPVHQGGLHNSMRALARRQARRQRNEEKAERKASREEKRQQKLTRTREWRDRVMASRQQPLDETEEFYNPCPIPGPSHTIIGWFSDGSASTETTEYYDAVNFINPSPRSRSLRFKERIKVETHGTSGIPGWWSGKNASNSPQK